jgi:hypothetical protein
MFSGKWPWLAVVVELLFWAGSEARAKDILVPPYVRKGGVLVDPTTFGYFETRWRRWPVSRCLVEPPRTSVPDTPWHSGPLPHNPAHPDRPRTPQVLPDETSPEATLKLRGKTAVPPLLYPQEDGIPPTGAVLKDPHP